VNDKHDRRSQRTRHLLSAALVELIREKEYNTITVSDIIDRANVGRSTFYAHFRDKDDLFVGELDRVIELLSQRIPNQEQMPFFPSLGLFRHVGEEYQLYKSLLWGPGIDLLIKHMQKSLSKRIEQGLLESGREFNIPIPILANFIAGSFLTLLQWWLENKMVYSPEEMDKTFKELIMAGLEKKNDENKTATQ
jgi:AcrR family transcriptional regulator